MSDQEIKNPLLGKPLHMDDYESQNPQTLEIMDKIFETFPFTKDFEKVYTRALYTVVRLETKEIKKNGYYYSCHTYHNIVDGSATYFFIDFGETGSSHDEHPLERQDDDGTFVVCHTHFLAIAPKNYSSVHWQDRVIGLLEAFGYSLSIVDSNPENNSFFVTKDGRKLSGPCRAEDVFEGELRLNDPDSLILQAKKDGICLLFKYSYIPFDALNLSSK